MYTANGDRGAFILGIAACVCFIVCPRMTAMTTIISQNISGSFYSVVVFGTLTSLPLLIATA